ncbi:putative Cyclin-dependent kinase 2 [Blattamonas nauphoetae]|uniref:Cyclin-dependent kinase 2 n=1 Tax=Blattamonas nauphoetae TaxID=2049346 RepID=A0ABQ9X1K6_9EUKA|nr:putative Cyclin-dependent kinase 2 [Blattamonas nauphoetae]
MFSDSVVRKLGQGRFGSVYEVSKAGSDEHFAMKVLTFGSEEDFVKNEHEISKLQKYLHENVVRLVDVIEGDAAHYVVLELCSCSLADWMTAAQKLGTMMNRVTVFRILQDVLAGLGFLHSRNEVYGDVKPSTILIGSDGTAKLGDFGGVVGVGTQKTSTSAECGTMQFWGPEMFVVGGNAVHESLAGDMWAFGLIVLQLLTGQEWISGGNAVEIAESVKRFDFVYVCRQAEMSSSVEALLCFLLSKKPQERLSSAELIRSGRLRSILGEETPLSQFISEELDNTRSLIQAQLNERDNTISKLTIENKEKDDAIRQANETIRNRETVIVEKDELIAKQATTIAELTQKLGESVAMEKRLSDKPSTTQSKVDVVEAQVTEVAKDVKRIERKVDPEKAITVWNPAHFRKEGRRFTSLMDEWKSCFSDEITRGVWRLSIRCDKYDMHRFGVIDSSQLEECKTATLDFQSGASVFWLSTGTVHQDAKKIAKGNQRAKKNSVVTIELEMKRHTLVLFVDDQRQPDSLANIPQNVRFALNIYNKDRYADIVSFGHGFSW